MNKHKIRVMVVEDDPTWLQGISEIVQMEPDFQLVATAQTREAAWEAFSGQEVDVALMDINLTENECDGIDLAAEWIEQQAQLKVIMLTSLTEEEVIVDAFSAGAINYLNKLHFREIPEAIRSAFSKSSAIHPTAAAVLRKEFQRMKQQENESLLTPAEKDVLKFIHEGHTQAQAAEKLFVTERTIKNHINRILKKMGLTSSKEAAEVAKKKRMF
ncbi:DNA-binding response regulator [Ammoniphilus oxalaticus]|uniref:DNA-binding response regulator n=1 Tax=Ammoniphilus oxalaticus TaxID=66863 RepID=A0A419SQQ1_9BACL|nr:response regulator transcription factor [Ammoniphilus oxalaticus]RKD26822.1 DNA-binding response regulator [Ammoniphilus oxalaticus]